MNYWARVLGFGLMLVSLFPCYVYPQSLPVAQAQIVEGTVSAQRDGEGLRALGVCSSVFSTDTLKTGVDSRGQFLFLDQSVLVMNSDSELRIDSFVYAYTNDPKANEMHLTLGQGLFRAVTGKLIKKNPDVFRIDSPYLAIGVRGTDFGVQNSGKNNKVVVFEGGPAVVTDKEFNKSVDVPAGKYVTKDKGEPLSDVRDITEEMRNTFEKAKKSTPAPPGC